eukprot:654239-Amphidinium_carterae.1
MSIQTECSSARHQSEMDMDLIMIWALGWGRCVVCRERSLSLHSRGSWGSRVPANPGIKVFNESLAGRNQATAPSGPSNQTAVIHDKAPAHCAIATLTLANGVEWCSPRVVGAKQQQQIDKWGLRLADGQS